LKTARKNLFQSCFRKQARDGDGADWRRAAIEYLCLGNGRHKIGEQKESVANIDRADAEKTQWSM
jgi:hypothetical protein